MSSHHIVREKQEPALFICALGNFDREYLGQILEWSPTIIIPFYLLEEVVAMGIKVDVVMDTELVNVTSQQEHVRVVQYQQNVLAATLHYLVNNGYPAVNIIDDAFKSDDYEQFLPLIDLVIFKDDFKIYPIRTGFSKWQAKGRKVMVLQQSVFSAIDTTGLSATHKNEFITDKDGFFSFDFAQPFIFIAEEL